MPRKPEPRYHKGRRRWYACFGEKRADGKARQVYAPESVQTKADAWRWFDQEIKARETVPVRRGEETVEWVFERYLAWAEQRRDEGRMDAHHFTNRTGHLELFGRRFSPRIARTIEPKDLTEFLETLLSIYAPSYVRNIGSSVRAAFNWAVKAKHLDRNPVQGYEAPTLPRSGHRFAERQEAAAFLRFWRSRVDRKTLRGRYQRITLLMERCLIRTGARPKELCQLKWKDIQWDAWTGRGGHPAAKAILKEWKAGKKTGKPRTIIFTPILTRALRRLQTRGVNREWVFVHGQGRGGIGGGQPWPDGSRLSKTICRVRREMIAHQKELRKRSDLKPWERRLAEIEIRDEGENRVTNYRWRHSAISSLLMLGVDASTVAELTGTSPQMIWMHYGHIQDSHLTSAAEKLGGRSKL